MCTARRQKEETSNLQNYHFGSLEATLLRVGVLIINLLLSIRSLKSYQVLMNFTPNSHCVTFLWLIASMAHCACVRYKCCLEFDHMSF